MIVRMSTENFKWLRLIVTEISTFKKWDVRNIIFMFVACLNSRQFRHIENKSINEYVFKLAFYEYIIHKGAPCNNISRDH